MKLLDIAKEFADINIFNDFTHITLLDKVKVFCNRSEVEYIDDLTLEAVTLFKKRTLKIARPVTYNGYIRYLRLVLDYAQARGYANQNIFRSVRLAPVGSIPRKVMQLETIDKVCLHIQQHWSDYRPHWFWLSVIYTFYYTGMRRRQLVSLRLCDLDFQNSQILLNYEGSKTNRSWKIPMHKDLSDRLHDLILRSEAKLGRQLKGSEYLFVASRFYPRYQTGKDGRMKAESVSGFFKRLGRDLGVSIGAHRFRHTLATELCNPVGDDSPDIFAVQALLGHTSIQTTRGYTQTRMNSMENALDKIRVPFTRPYA